MQAESPRKHRRRWLQFGLRSLLLLTTVFGVWLGLYMQRVRRQQEAVRAIRDFGGWVHYDYQRVHEGDDAFTFAPVSKPPVPDWLLSRLSEDFFFNVVEAGIFTDKHSGQFTVDGNLASDVLRRLAALPQLRWLTIATEPTDDDLHTIASLRTLEHLDLWHANSITDEGVSRLSDLTNLETIWLIDSDIGEAGLRSLSTLPAIKTIKLFGGRIGDRELEALKGCRQLRTLALRNSREKITDAGMRHLIGLTHLEYLALEATDVTDAGLEYLKSLTNLEALDLSGTRATGEDFNKSVPECSVIH